MLGSCSTAGIAIGAAQSVMFMESDNSDHSDTTVNLKKEMHSLIGYHVRDFKGVITAIIVMNTWCRDPELYLALLRRSTPIAFIVPRVNSV